MQHIALEWQDEGGNTLARYEGPEIAGRVFNAFPRSGTCLRFVDPYGDTTFNQAQVEALATELDALIATGSHRASNDALVAMRRFAEQARGHVHTYLKFIGD